MGHRRRIVLGAIIAAGLLTAGCSSSDEGSSSGTISPSEAQEAFCSDLGDQITALDTYGRVFTAAPLTIGDLQAGATELEAGREKLEASASQLEDAIRAANALAEATAGTAAVDATTTTVLASKSAQDHIDSINSAERELSRTLAGVEASTPVAQATAEVQAAAFGLQQAYGSLFLDAGCLTTNPAAVEAVRSYVTALQQDLTTVGFYTGPIDGLYGPATVTAVKALQASAGLPQTGLVDPSTERALVAQLAANGTQQSLNIAALQGALTTTGFYSGPIDGTWSDDLESAVRAFQTSQNLEVTGVIDPATLAALLRLGTSDGSTTTTSAPTSTTAVVASTSTPTR